MRARLRYLLVSPTTPRAIAQRVIELGVLLLAIAVLVGSFQLHGLVMLGLGVEVGAL